MYKRQSEHSGLAGIAFWINTLFRLKGKERVSKDDPMLKSVQDEVMKQYQEGRVTAMLDEEVLALVKRYMPNLWEMYKERIADSSMLGS